MDIANIERFVKLVEQSELHTVTVAEGHQSITVVNKRNQSTTINTADATEIIADKTLSESWQVRSKYVGRVHLAQDKAMDNMVNKGDLIEKGQTLYFIEVLNRLLPVISDKPGTVSAILVDEGQNIEYGQPILTLKRNT